MPFQSVPFVSLDDHKDSIFIELLLCPRRSVRQHTFINPFILRGNPVVESVEFVEPVFYRGAAQRVWTW